MALAITAITAFYVHSIGFVHPRVPNLIDLRSTSTMPA